MIPGFDPEFQDLEHYILVITERIWEGQRLGDIHRYYSDDCVVETPLGISRGIAPVIDGTRATLAEFPDRELLGEDVLVSGEAATGLLSSHRIFSPMTQRGDGRFGPASGRPVQARTIADCVCRDNRIVHEWLVRDHGAIARQLGWRLPDLARAWLAQQPLWTPPAPTVAPAPYRPTRSDQPLAQRSCEFALGGWHGDAALALCDRAVESALPGGETVHGLAALQAHWQSWREALALEALVIEQATVCERPQRAPVVALRWRARLRHSGGGRFGEPTGRTVDLLAIQHLQWHGPRIARQWLLIDEVALWMQLLRA
jgi:hypothetical protein